MIEIVIRDIRSGEEYPQEVCKSKTEAMHMIMILLPKTVAGWPHPAQYVRRSEVFHMAYLWPPFRWVYARHV